MKSRKIKLSIITPYYNTLKYIKELAQVLEPQLIDETEWIIIDDGCNEKELDLLKAKVIHLEKNSGGASKPRNKGLEIASGEYIAFIDSDDMIAKDYINTIIKSLKTDIVFISWRSNKHNVIMNNRPPRWNCSVWSRIYKREIIKNIKFDEDLKIAEDWKFNKEIKYETYTSIKKQIYFYNCDRKGSLTRD